MIISMQKILRNWLILSRDIDDQRNLQSHPPKSDSFRSYLSLITLFTQKVPDINWFLPEISMIKRSCSLNESILGHEWHTIFFSHICFSQSKRALLCTIFRVKKRYKWIKVLVKDKKKPMLDEFLGFFFMGFFFQKFGSNSLWPLIKTL